MIAGWVGALMRRRPGGFLATSLGIAAAVGLLASVGAFIAVAQSTMTDRALSNVAVDWQVQLTAGADVASATDIVKSASGVQSVTPVDFAQADSFSATTAATGTDSTTQTTGAGVVLGLPAAYATTFPGEVRLLTGSADGALVAQQTAANLHVAPGDTVAITFAGRPVNVVVSGIVELPQANSLFQIVGASAASQPTAPPDNVILLSADAFSTATASVVTSRPDLLTTQLHVATDRALDPAPAAAYVQVTQAANNLEVKLAGVGRVGDNLAASLDAARSDAAYAQVLFLFLGLPGAVLAALLTIAFAAADAAGRRRDEALLRLRGASVRAIAGLAAGEAASVAVVGGVVGLVAAWAVSAAVLGADVVGATLGTAWPWFVAAFIAGVIVASLAVLVPAVSASRSLTVSEARQQVTVSVTPWWSRAGLDIILIVVGIIVFVITTQTGYSLVLAPEGVATINVNYWAFLGPALLWVGFGLVGWRLFRLVLNRRRAVAVGIRPLTGRLASTGAAMFARRGGALTRSAVLLGIAIAFAGSTAVFNSTYEQQAEVDARLTNGADVRVVLPAGVDPATQTPLASVQGVQHVEPLQHRYAYVGADLQDMYGVSPTTIASATSLQDAYFQGGTAAKLLAKLAATPDGVLVSAETVTDYQLNLGDAITLRVVDSTHPTPTPVTFHYIGVALEFPTAPHDSFLVTNADYVAGQTGDTSVDTYLINTAGTPPDAVAHNVQKVTGSLSTVTPIGSSRTSIGSSLTSVNLHGLTTIELGFAAVLAVAAAGLALLLGLRERRRTVAISSLMGVSSSQLRRLVFAEAMLVLIGGLIIGTVMAVVLSQVLVAVLAGVFDPPPAALAIPWPYLILVAASVALATIATAAAVARGSRRPPVELLREG